MTGLSHHPYPTDWPAAQHVYGRDVASGPMLVKVSVKADCEVDVVDLAISEAEVHTSVALSPDKAIRVARSILEVAAFARRSHWTIPTLCKTTVTVRRIDSVMLVLVLGANGSAEDQVLLDHKAAADLALHLIDAARFITNVAQGFYDPEVSSTWDRVCRKCGCSDESACETGCSWVSYNLCSACRADACDVCLQPASARKVKPRKGARR